MYTPITSFAANSETNEQEAKWEPEPVWMVWRRELLPMPENKSQVLWYPIQKLGQFTDCTAQNSLNVLTDSPHKSCCTDCPAQITVVVLNVQVT